MPRVSVILPTYNRAHVLRRAIHSLLNQTYQDYELVIVDDGSTDDTSEAIDMFRNNRIIYIKNEHNRGEGYSRNVGIEKATGEYLAFQDSDDESLPTRLEKEIAVLDRAGKGVGMVYTDMYRICRNGEKHVIKSPHFSPDNGILYPASLGFTLKNIGIGTAMIRRDTARKAGLFDSELAYFVDLEYFIRLSKICCFAHIPEPLLNYYEEETVFATLSRSAEARKKILSKYYDEINSNKNMMALHLFAIGNDLCYSGNMDEGKSYIKKSLILYPFHILRISGLLSSYLGPNGYRYLVDMKNRLFS